MIIGIYGPIASGKDEAVKILNEILNSNISLIIDADKFGKFVVENNFNRISNIFNVKNLYELSNLVFSDFSTFINYNNFIHPILSSKLRIILENQILKGEKIILLNCALLFRFKLEFFCDKIFYIDAEKELKIERLIKRNKITKEEAEKRIDFQERIENYKRIQEICKFYISSKIHFIKNNENIEVLKEKVKKIII